MTDFNKLERDRAVISENGRYRYALYRRLDGRRAETSARKACLFVMLNPSTADGTKDDATIRRCVGFARGWACDELFVANLFAWRATKPADLRCKRTGAGDIVGSENMAWMQAMADVCKNRAPVPGPIVCAWGPNGRYMDQDQTALGWLIGYDLYCLGRSKDGSPRHPLMLKKSAQLERFS